ncbi:hypothetical protein A3C37_05600 [Candidatus Peribacteria bacterium RIFCSPHIGHO2_02_FULL_53_20]|nr:MAG: hypothetical protein A3C37_05600 [Candidatus Peribacteria bacterium RIFCSPHIGHO2_02_FULL_53_20]HLD71936.1 hypothetical protein [Candidatus Peribacteraceae bacterium]
MDNANANSSSGVIVGIVAIVAILLLVAIALKVFQLYPGDKSDNTLKIDINTNIPTQQNPS